jgi:hypothetical protein
MAGDHLAVGQGLVLGGPLVVQLPEQRRSDLGDRAGSCGFEQRTRCLRPRRRLVHQGPLSSSVCPIRCSALPRTGSTAGASVRGMPLDGSEIEQIRSTLRQHRATYRSAAEIVVSKQFLAELKPHTPQW